MDRKEFADELVRILAHKLLKDEDWNPKALLVYAAQLGDWEATDLCARWQEALEEAEREMESGEGTR